MLIDLDHLEEVLEDSEAMFLEPRATFDRAIVGIASRINMLVVAYDRALCIECLMGDGMDEGEAEEFFEFNTAGAWVGPGTPVFITRLLPSAQLGLSPDTLALEGRGSPR